ncbi:MAG: siderophore-interacting protein, partial [Corynebacterium variabile]
MPRISRDTDIYPISLRELEVLRVEDITPAMRRVTFGGAGLLAHTRDGEPVPALVSDGFDDDVRLILPDPETGDRPYPKSLGDGRLDWNEQVNDLFRTYTVRTWTPDAGEYGELAIDFARHGAGLAEGWSASASAGDRVFIAGPKNCGAHPSHTDWLLLVGDETALPAIGRCLENCPAGHPVVAVVEVPTRADIQDIDCAADLDMHWVVRDEGGEARRDRVTVVGWDRETT